jgi:hypothetical protein
VIPAYKQLESKTKIAELTLGQWVGVIAGVMCALVIIAWLRPFGMYANLVLGVYAGGIPITIALVVSIGEFDVWLLVRAACRWRRADGRYAAGPGSSARGYEISGADRSEESGGSVPVDVQLLWETRPDGGRR